MSSSNLSEQQNTHRNAPYRREPDRKLTLDKGDEITIPGIFYLRALKERIAEASLYLTEQIDKGYQRLDVLSAERRAIRERDPQTAEDRKALRDILDEGDKLYQSIQDWKKRREEAIQEVRQSDRTTCFRALELQDSRHQRDEGPQTRHTGKTERNRKKKCLLRNQTVSSDKAGKAGKAGKADKKKK